MIIRHVAAYPLWIVAVSLTWSSALPRSFGQDSPPQSTEESAREAEQARRRQEETNERVRRIVMQFAARARETKVMVESLAAAEKSLSERMAAMKTNDDGKRFAQDRTAFFEFVQLDSQPIVSAEQIRGRQAAISSLVDGLEQELKRDAVGFVPKDETVREVDEILYWCRERLAALNQKKAWIDATVARAPKDLNLANSPTLQDRIRDDLAAREQMFAKARLAGEEEGRKLGASEIAEAARVAELQRALAEKERMLNDLQAELERRKLDFELKYKLQQEEQIRLLADADRRLKDAQAEVERQTKLADARREAENLDNAREAEKVLSEAQKRELIDRCKSEEVQTRLAPFVTPGYYQPGRNAEMTVDKMPMSLSKLRAFGALSNTPEGYKKLIIVGSYSQDKVRPRWGFDYALVQSRNAKDIIGQLRPDQMDGLRTVQGYLNELGPTLVELGMLSP